MAVGGRLAPLSRCPFSELRLSIGQKLLNLVADGVTDPIRLRWLTVESLLFPRH